MSVIVIGMEMPKYTTKAEFGIDADGNPFCMVYHEAGTEPDIYDIVPLPERHGRLIDADALESTVDDRYTFGEIGRRERDDIVSALRYNAPTIVEAEGD